MKTLKKISVEHLWSFIRPGQTFSYLMLPVVFLSFTMFSCEKQIPEVDPPVFKYQGDKKAEALVSAGNAFGLDLFRLIAEDDACPENMMMSPVSVAMALGMTYNGAEGETKTAFESTLRYQGFTRDEINEIHRSLIEFLVKADPKVVLEIANSIWYKDDFKVLQDFIDVNRKHYFAEIRDLDFEKPGAVNIINNWCAEKTHDKIKEVIDEIPPDAVMYLINALYFNGIWKYEFDSKNSFDGKFYPGDNKELTVEYMKKEGSLSYFSNDLLSAVELPYGNGNFVMNIFLPNTGKSLNDIYSILDESTWKTWLNSFTKREEVVVQLPKFKYEYETILNKPLMEMGLRPAFLPGIADFRGIHPTAELSISRVIHKTFIDVNEKGTEAAAVTVVEIRVTSVGPGSEKIYFTVDRPFMYSIREKNSGALLFMGKVEHPDYK